MQLHLAALEKKLPLSLHKASLRAGAARTMPANQKNLAETTWPRTPHQVDTQKKHLVKPVK